MNLNNLKIVIVGTGNLASQLIPTFLHQQINITQVVSRSNKISLKNRFGEIFEIVSNIKNVQTDADLYFIMVNDDNINDVVKSWPFKLNKQQTIIHCSGSVKSKIFKSISHNYGVFWPIQSITKLKEIDWSEIPIVITGNNKKTKIAIHSIASTITNNICFVSDKEREKLHMMAVLLNNFSNHLFVLAEEYLNNHDLPFHLFIPILKETVNRLESNSPSQLQTGPAARKDLETIQKHISKLKKHPNLQKIYKLMSKSIMNQSGK